MDIDHDLAREYRPALTSQGYVAPLEVFAAALSFGRPTEMHTWYEATSHGSRWLVLGRLDQGILIVDAESATEGWVWEPQYGADRNVRAEWYPLDAIESVQIVEVALYSDPDAMISCDLAWQLCVRGRGEIRLPSSTTRSDPTEFCRQLIADR